MLSPQPCTHSLIVSRSYWIAVLVGSKLAEVITMLNLPFVVRKQQNQQDQPSKPCGECPCLEQIKTDIPEILKWIGTHPKKIAEALFECFEAMQCFDYNSELSYGLFCAIWAVTARLAWNTILGSRLQCACTIFVAQYTVIVKSEHIHARVFCSPHLYSSLGDACKLHC